MLRYSPCGPEPGEPLPDPVWEAIANHHHPDDSWRLAGNAEQRGQIEHAITLYLSQVEACDRYTASQATERLVRLLVEKGRVEEAIAVLRPQAGNGDFLAAGRLADLLIEQGRVEELRQRAAAGDRHSRMLLAALLAEMLGGQSGTEKLRQHGYPPGWIAERVAEALDRASSEETIAFLQQRADADDGLAGRGLARLLADEGRVEEAIAMLWRRADNGDGFAAGQLVDPLAEHRGTEEAIAMLRQWADDGDSSAADQLVNLLAKQGRIDAPAVIRSAAFRVLLGVTGKAWRRPHGPGALSAHDHAGRSLAAPRSRVRPEIATGLCSVPCQSGPATNVVNCA